ncbi:MAG: hypothetical protein Kilf2KO_33580 [Rhodospirillales bacterium]
MAVVTGSDALNDTLTGSNAVGRIFGLGGDDSLVGLGGDDRRGLTRGSRNAVGAAAAPEIGRSDRKTACVELGDRRGHYFW